MAMSNNIFVFVDLLRCNSFINRIVVPIITYISTDTNVNQYPSLKGDNIAEIKLVEVMAQNTDRSSIVGYSCIMNLFRSLLLYRLQSILSEYMKKPEIKKNNGIRNVTNILLIELSG